MREIRTSGSMSGDGKRDQYACGVQSTRARPRLYHGDPHAYRNSCATAEVSRLHFFSSSASRSRPAAVSP